MGKILNSLAKIPRIVNPAIVMTTNLGRAIGSKTRFGVIAIVVNPTTNNKRLLRC
jgi:hypothetical protein